MKKFLALILSVVLIFSASSIVSYAYEEAQVSSSNEIILEKAEGLYNSNGNERASGLINAKSISLSKTNSQLLITAQTIGTTEVSKCGFTYIKLQRLVNGSWVDYSTYCYSDLYSESNSYAFSKYVSPPSGYTYRVVCEHYAAKKVLLIFTSDETSYNETSSLYF